MNPMRNPAMLTTPLISQVLSLLYNGMALSEEMLNYRAALANEYHARTGTYFAARFY